jgi:hypothetical protein
VANEATKGGEPTVCFPGDPTRKDLTMTIGKRPKGDSYQCPLTDKSWQFYEVTPGHQSARIQSAVRSFAVRQCLGPVPSTERDGKGDES